MMNYRRLDQLEKSLREAGDTHTLADIIAGINEGRLQSFCVNETWAVTSIIVTPQKKVCEIFLCIGDMADALVLHDQVETFAKTKGCTLIRTIARKGWAREAHRHGWRNGHDVFLKELV